MYNGGPAAGMSAGVRMGEPGFSPPIPAVGPGSFLHNSFAEWK